MKNFLVHPWSVVAWKTFDYMLRLISFLSLRIYCIQKNKVIQVDPLSTQEIAVCVYGLRDLEYLLKVVTYNMRREENGKFNFTFVSMKPGKREALAGLEKAKRYALRELEFSEKLQLLEEIDYEDDLVIKAFQEEYRNRCDEVEFTTKATLDLELLSSLFASEFYAKKLFLEFDGFILTEANYVFSTTIASLGKRLNKQTILVDASGAVRNLSFYKKPTNPIPSSEEVVSCLKKLELSDRVVINGQADLMFLSRLSESFETIPPAINPELTKNRELSDLSAKDKILFLHVFRDATGFYKYGFNREIVGRSAYHSYVDWTEACIKEIAIDPSTWKIRPHPGSEHYKGDQQALSSLLKKYDLDNSILLESINLKNLLSLRPNIYTFSGSISLECAASGFKAICASDFYPKSIAIHAVTEREWIRQMHNPASEMVTQESSDLAKLLILLNTEPFTWLKLSGITNYAQVVNTNSSVDRMKVRFNALIKSIANSNGRVNQDKISEFCHLMSQQFIDPTSDHFLCEKLFNLMIKRLKTSDGSSYC